MEQVSTPSNPDTPVFEGLAVTSTEDESSERDDVVSMPVEVVADQRLRRGTRNRQPPAWM